MFGKGGIDAFEAMKNGDPMRMRIGVDPACDERTGVRSVQVVTASTVYSSISHVRRYIHIAWFHSWDVMR